MKKKKKKTMAPHARLTKKRQEGLGSGPLARYNTY
jgi:hypothetical protein